MPATNWEYILDTIRAEKCILMLGPDVLVDQLGRPLHQALEEYLEVKKNPQMAYFSEDEFFLFKDETAKFPTYLNIQKFYTQQQPPAIYQKLAALPFHLIISLSPDLAFKKVCEQHQLHLQFDYYRKYENPKPVRRPTKDEPLLYNLFGSIEDDESMIFTHDDMFEFLFAITGRHQLPDEIRNELKTAKSFILLGFEFDKWYVKLVLRLFNLHSGRFMRYASESMAPLAPSTKEWYEHLFKITFVEKQVQLFVDELYERSEKAGLLRKIGHGAHVPLTLSEQVRAYVNADDVEKAIELLSQFFDSLGKEELLNDLSLLSNGYRRLKRRMGTSTISDADAEVRMSQIISGILDLAEETVV